MANTLVNKLKLSVILLAAFGAVAIVSIGVRAAEPQPAKVTEVEGITEYRLANGLRVLLFPDQSKPTITVNMTVMVGSRHENYGETGMAHLLEHMLFKGTKNRVDVAKEMNVHGARFNGTTSLDRTNYYEIIQSTDENLNWALGMEADRLVNALIARKDLDTEMTVVRNEYENGENSPVSVLIKRMQSMSYDWHNYGHSTIGNRSDIENVDISHLQAFYHQYYQPDNAVLLVAGKFDPAKVLPLVSKYFDVIPKPSRTLPKLWTVEPTQDGERSFMVRRVGDLQVVIAGYKIPSALHADVQALSYAQFALTDTPSGRLHKALVETGKAAQVASLRLSGVDGSLLGIIAVVKKGEPIDAVQAELIKQVENLKDNPLSKEEMDRARQNFANAAERTLNDHETIGLQLSEFIALGDWRMFFLSRDRTQQVTAAQVQEVAGKYLRRDNRTVGVFLHDDKPERAEIPAVSSAADMLKDYKPKTVTNAAEEFDPSSENIERRVHRLEIGGMKLALLSKKTKGETVQFAMSLPFGDEKSLNGQSFNSALAGQMLPMGTTRFTRSQLRDEFSKLKVSGGVAGPGANFQTTRENVVAAIKLAAHVLREPSFPADEFEQLKKLLVTSIESQMSDPQARASEAMGQLFNIYPKGDPRYAPSLQERLDGIKATTLDEVKQFHKKFYAANHAEIAVVGDFDEAEVQKAIQEGFGDWRNDTAWARLIADYRNVSAKNISIETPDKENAFFMARLNLDTNQSDPDYAAFFLADYMLGGGAQFDSRLMARIRVKEGLSYGVGSNGGGPIFGRAGSWNAFAIAAPQNVAKVEVALLDELNKAVKDGFTDEEIAKAKSGWKQGFAQIRVQDAQLAGRLVSHLDSDRTFLTWDKVFEDRMLALTADEIRAAVRKYIDPSRLTIVKAGDFAKVAREKK